MMPRQLFGVNPVWKSFSRDISSTRTLSFHLNLNGFSLYYSNNLMSGNSLNFSKKQNNSSCLRFTPNYRFAAITRSLTSGTSSSQSPSSASPVSKVSNICHPPAQANAHIPFQVKLKDQKKDTRSVLELYQQGEIKNLKQLFNPYMALTKPNLTFLIMLSSICSYTLAPGSADVSKFVFLTIGTLLASGAANAINMGREPNFDSQMVRTSARPVVTGLVKPHEAFKFAAITGTLGCSILYLGVNPIVAALGATNIVLYSWLYTSLKRKSILNTWVGAIVGAIPPLMGWATCSSLADPGAWCLALLLYAWQFPHFNTLSHNIKDEYKRAGYVMTAFVNPKLNARVALRYSLLMFPICFAMVYYGVCDSYFVFDSSILNAWMSYTSFKFWLQQRHNYSSKVLQSGGPSTNDINMANVWAKKTFWSSIWHLPIVMILAMLHKKGQWDRFFGDPNQEELKP
ncbi:uncharacterized protein C5L36_0C06400 [Pichia kudriavzevii]|uniref:Protoheme IX farnesyltransferase, mitochondrial n=3 Tax=Pichia kudriavzevii TaxID=4909 RepID=A0A2U9R5S3_PICKU|nr:uncharacterized protein C5L36_0C06400 [Pichia kudriavzevii]AWU76717.1 hypothetical protein C5L36_0C06400 [Pichia kudriavzevii]